MSGPSTTTYDPLDPRWMADPWPRYDELRERAPVHRSPRGFWVLTRHADCLALLRDRRASVDGMKIDPRRAPEGFESSASRPRATTGMLEGGEDARPFLFRDPPDHTRLRGLVAKAFTPRMVEGLRPRVEAVVTELVERALEAGEADAVAGLAYPLPVRIICEMMGVPSEDHERFQSWSAALARGLDPEFLLSDDQIVERDAAVTAFAEYFFALLVDRDGKGGEDLLSQLARAEEDGSSLTMGELLSTAILLLVAGHETTVNLIAGGLLALLQHPDQLRSLRAEPELARRGVDELMRFVSPVQLTGRVLLEDVEVADTTLPGGEFAMTLLAAANRDPDVFADPGRLDLRRNAAAQLGFGFGIHHCLGAPLARLEAEVALGTLVARARSLELTSDEVRYRPNIVLRGLEALPISLLAA